MPMQTISGLFLLLVFVMAAVVITLLFSYARNGARSLSIGIFLAWLAYAGLLGYAGVLSWKKPPGPMLVVVPFVLFTTLFLLRNSSVKDFASRVPLSLLLALQGFRIFVELALLGLYQNGLVPRMLTFEGSNFDIIIGLSGPILAILSASNVIGARTIRIWTFVGIAMLLNVIVRSFLTFSGIIHAEVPNVGIAQFPFSFIPGFLAPLALALHILVLRALPTNVNGKALRVSETKIGVKA